MKALLCIALATSAFFIIACSRNAYSTTNRQYKAQAKALSKTLAVTNLHDSLPQVNQAWVGTTNFNLRKPNYVIIHHTAQNSCEQTLQTFTKTTTAVSAHYVICKDGRMHHMLNDYLRAWHGGIGKWGGQTDINSASIGIEIDNNGVDSFSSAQITTLLQLLGNLKRAYAIPTANFIGHSDIAPTRKVDPNVTFPWKTLADAGFGLWWSDTTGMQVPREFNAMQALRIIGYDIKDSAATVQAFNRKYLQTDKISVLTDVSRKVLYALYRKYE